MVTALFLDADVQHAVCLASYEQALRADQEMAAPGLLLVEVAASLRRGVALPRIRAVIEEFEASIL